MQWYRVVTELYNDDGHGDTYLWTETRLVQAADHQLAMAEAIEQSRGTIHKLGAGGVNGVKSCAPL
jgi:hypothetical protein